MDFGMFLQLIILPSTQAILVFQHINIYSSSFNFLKRTYVPYKGLERAEGSIHQSRSKYPTFIQDLIFNVRIDLKL